MKNGDLIREVLNLVEKALMTRKGIETSLEMLRKATLNGSL